MQIPSYQHLSPPRRDLSPLSGPLLLASPADLERARSTYRPFEVRNSALLSWDSFSGVINGHVERMRSSISTTEEESEDGESDSWRKRYKSSLDSSPPNPHSSQQYVFEASCVDLKESVFYGDLHAREKVSIDFGIFASSFMQHLKEGSSDFLCTSGLNLYLSQVPIVDFCCNVSGDSDKSNNSLPEKIYMPELYGSCKCPEFLRDVSMRQINLWMNIASAESNLHYDSHDNVLFVIRGRKHVLLIEPGAICRPNVNGCHLSSGNHSKLTYGECLLNFKENCSLVSVSEGGALFIPNGFWHAVVSDECTVAINYWFDSDLQKQLDTCLLPLNKGMEVFSMRYLVSSMVENRTKDNSKRMRSEFRSKFTSIFSQLESNGLDNLPKSLDQVYVDFEHFLLSILEREVVSINQIMLSCDINEMMAWWPRFAKKYTEKWRTAFFSLTSESISLLLSYYDEVESKHAIEDELGTFYSEIYSYLDLNPTEIRRYLVSKQDEYSQQLREELLSTII